MTPISFWSIVTIIIVKVQNEVGKIKYEKKQESKMKKEVRPSKLYKHQI